MKKYIKELPSQPEFTQKGLNGFKFKTENKDVEFYIVDVKTGHDNYIISKKCTHFYFILKGSGSFVINGETLPAKKDMLFEVPPEVEYTYSGSMKLMLVMTPPWFKENEIITKENPDVFSNSR